MAGRNPSTSTDEVLAVFEDNPDTCEPFTAPQIAERLATDVHRNTARNYLQDLESLGELRTKKAGASRVWWRPCEQSDTE
jgi:predicted ArsR family transcriptional regulator